MIESNEKKLRYTELALVIAVAFLPSIIQSVYTCIFNIQIEIPDNINMYFLIAIIQQLIAISILVYILYRQGRKVDVIVAPFSPVDILHTIGLFILPYLAYSLICLTIRSLFPDFNLDSVNTEFMQKNITIFYVLFILVNPVFEELIVRAFLITEIVSITGKGSLAVALSVLIQISYHLYQGLIPAILLGIIFLTFSIYFLKYKRIMPIIIAHALIDILAMIYYGKT